MRAWKLVRRQHGVIARRQLLALGFHPQAITHRLATGRLHPIFRGVYAVGRKDIERKGVWMAAVLACGDGAVLSHASAAALAGFREPSEGPIDVSVPLNGPKGQPGIKTYRRSCLVAEDLMTRDSIPVTTVPVTLIDLATKLPEPELELAISAAARKHLITVDLLFSVLERVGNRPGSGIMRKLLRKQTFTLTETELERRFVPIALKAGLPKPLTQQRVNGHRVDFWFPQIGLVVETDGGAFHASASEQTADRIRDQTHAAAGLTPLRFTHWQVAYDRQHVEKTLRVVGQRLLAALPSP